jgi:hypothetical protein
MGGVGDPDRAWSKKSLLYKDSCVWEILAVRQRRCLSLADEPWKGSVALNHVSRQTDWHHVEEFDSQVGFQKSG